MLRFLDSKSTSRFSILLVSLFTIVLFSSQRVDAAQSAFFQGKRDSALRVNNAESGFSQGKQDSLLSIASSIFLTISTFSVQDTMSEVKTQVFSYFDTEFNHGIEFSICCSRDPFIVYKGSMSVNTNSKCYKDWDGENPCESEGRLCLPKTFKRTTRWNEELINNILTDIVKYLNGYDRMCKP